MSEERRERIRRMEQKHVESTRKDILRKYGGELSALRRDLKTLGVEVDEK